MNNIHCCLRFRISYKRNTHVNPSSTCTVLAHSLGFCLLVHLGFVTSPSQDRFPNCCTQSHEVLQTRDKAVEKDISITLRGHSLLL